MGRDRVGKKGVVRDPKAHEEVLLDIVRFAPTFGWQVHQLDYSPITGPEGNIEFVAHILPRRERQLCSRIPFRPHLRARALQRLHRAPGVSRGISPSAVNDQADPLQGFHPSS